MSNKANVVPSNVISSSASHTYTSVGDKREFWGSITLPANRRYLVFYTQESNVHSTDRMDTTYTSSGASASIPMGNSSMSSGRGSTLLEYFEASTSSRTIRYGMGYSYYNGSAKYSWFVKAIAIP